MDWYPFTNTGIFNQKCDFCQKLFVSGDRCEGTMTGGAYIVRHEKPCESAEYYVDQELTPFEQAEIEIRGLKAKIVDLENQLATSNHRHTTMLRKLVDFIKTQNLAIFKVSQAMSEVALPGCTSVDRSYRAIDGSWVKIEGEPKPVDTFWKVEVKK